MFDWLDTIVAGDAREVLRGLPAGCFNSIITSPPYYAKRLYGVSPLLWGGNPECDHDFSLATIGGDFRQNKVSANTSVGANKDMYDWAQVKQGNVYRNHLGPLASPYTEGVAQGHYIHRGSTKSNVVSDGQITDGFVEEAYCSKCGCWRGSLGNEPTISQYIENIVSIFDEVYRVLRNDGNVFVNISDTFWGGGHGGNTFYPTPDGDFKSQKQRESGNSIPVVKWGKDYPRKCLCLIPERFAIAMQEHGWVVRQVIAWISKNKMPEAVEDRFTSSWEFIYHFTKQGDYYFDQQFEPLADPDRTNFQSGSRVHGENPDRNDNDLGMRSKDLSFPLGKNRRNVFNVNTSPCNWEFCHDCKTLFVGKERKEIRIEKWTDDRGIERRKRICTCVSSTGWIDHFACVDEDTECLTMNGWKKYDQLNIGEIIATFDLDLGLLRWDRLNNIFVHDYDDNLVKINNPCIPFRFTPNHRMVCRTLQGKRSILSGFHIREAKDITVRDKFPVSADWESGSFGILDSPSPDLCELLGWICAEGHYRKYSVDISQSFTANREKVLHIKALLDRMEIKYTYRISAKSGERKGYQMAHFCIAWAEFRKIYPYIPSKKPTYQMALWEKECIKRFLDGFIDGDGSKRKDDSRMSITQKDECTVDVLMAMAFRLGYRVIKSYRLNRKINYGIYVLYLTKHKLSSARTTNGYKLNITKEHYTGKVWCPQTNTGTWVARKNGRIIITGNSYSTKLISPLISASVPKEICVKCGKPRESIYEKTDDIAYKRWSKPSKLAEMQGLSDTSAIYQGEIREKKLVGYSDCGCGEEFRTGICLDPFMGSGTTGIECIRQGKHYFGIDLNSSYAEVANARCAREKDNQALPLLPKKRQAEAGRSSVPDTQLDLFAGLSISSSLP